MKWNQTDAFRQVKMLYTSKKHSEAATLEKKIIEKIWACQVALLVRQPASAGDIRDERRSLSWEDPEGGMANFTQVLCLRILVDKRFGSYSP